MLKVHCY